MDVIYNTIMALNYKIILVGDGGVGKSVFIKRADTGEFRQKYIPTQGVDVSVLRYPTNYGTVTFKIWDCAGQEKFGGLRDGYYIGADGAIVMFDLTSRITYKNSKNWINDVKKTCPDIPIVVCGNKTDIPDKKVNGRIDAIDIPNVIKYYSVSAKSNYNFEKPWLALAKKLTGHEDLEFIEKVL